MTRLEFLEDTVKWYSENPDRRCFNHDGKCLYSPKNALNNTESTGCAIGIHLSPELASYLDEHYTNSGVERVFEDLPDNLKELGVAFLSNIQYLHDIDSFWTKESLSERGKEFVNEIKERFCQ